MNVNIWSTCQECGQEQVHNVALSPDMMDAFKKIMVLCTACKKNYVIAVTVEVIVSTYQIVPGSIRPVARQK